MLLSQFRTEAIFLPLLCSECQAKCFAFPLHSTGTCTCVLSGAPPRVSVLEPQILHRSSMSGCGVCMLHAQRQSTEVASYPGPSHPVCTSANKIWIRKTRVASFPVSTPSFFSRYKKNCFFYNMRGGKAGSGDWERG